MTSADSKPCNVGRGKHELQLGSLLPTNGKTEIFAAFLDAFTDGAWPLTSTGGIAGYKKEMLSVSSHTHEDYSCHRTDAKLVGTAAVASVSVDTADESLHQAQRDNCKISSLQPISGGTETRVDSSPVIDKDDTADEDASSTPNKLYLRKTILHSSVRRLTNSTYLRRMHLSKEDALGLFPEVKGSLKLVFTTNVTRRESSKPLKKGTLVYIHDVEGRRWPVVIECLRTAGQRHVRFNKGWPEICSANGLSIGTCFRLARWKEALSPSSSLVAAALSPSSHGTSSSVTLSAV